MLQKKKSVPADMLSRSALPKFLESEPETGLAPSTFPPISSLLMAATATAEAAASASASASASQSSK